MPNAAIAGPRRIKQQAPPPVQPPRQLPPVDPRLQARNADPASRAQPGVKLAPMPIVTTLPARRKGVRRLRWFILGIAFGALGAVLARGESSQTLHDLRAWSARALRSLERTAPPPPAKARPSTATHAAKPVALVIEAPCPMNPGPGDPCADLLAPFLDPPKPPVPTVSVEALPRVRPPVMARHHRHVVSAPAPAASVADDPQEPPADDEQQVTTAENDPPPLQ